MVDGAVRQPRLARLASTCQPLNPTPMLSASPPSTRARPASPPRATRAAQFGGRAAVAQQFRVVDQNDAGPGE